MTHDNVLILGANGGVAGAVLGLLQGCATGARLLDGVAALYLLDQTEVTAAAALPQARPLPPCRIDAVGTFERLLHRHAIDLVVDLAGIDTMDLVLACSQTGADYLGTSYDVWRTIQADPVDRRRLILVRSQELLPGRRPRLAGGSYLLTSGMNPGLVNALALVGIERFAEICGVAANPEALALYAILYTECDTTTQRGAATLDGNGFAMSWNPLDCLEELLEPETGYLRRGSIRFVAHPPTGALYRARCGGELIEGMLVPHEEVVTIGSRFPELEVAFIYRILPTAHRALLAHPNRCPQDWTTINLYPPTTYALNGEDRVGVLLCSRTHGEYWIGFRNTVAEGLRYGTNATLLQVAAGVIAGWHSMRPDCGVHLVEELDWRRYLRIAESVLGPVEVFWDRRAPVVGVEQRRVRPTLQ